MSWLGLTHKGTEPLYSDEWNRVVDALDTLYAYVSNLEVDKLDRAELFYFKYDIIPDQDNKRRLGTDARSWKEIHAHYGYFKDNVYVQGKAVIKDGDPVKISEFIDLAKADVEKFYSLHTGIKQDTSKLDTPLSDLRSKIEQLYGVVRELNSKIQKTMLQFNDGALGIDTRFAQRIELGYSFSASRRIEGLPAENSEDTWFENPSGSGREVNIVAVEVAGLGSGWIDIYHGNIKVSAGIPIEKINLNLGSPNQAVALPEYGGSYTPGKLAHSTVLPGGIKINAIGSMAEVGERLKLPPGYNILIRLTNKAGTTTDYSIRFLWWEDFLS